MLTILEILIITANIPVLIWALLPVNRVPRFLDFMPLASVVFLILHLIIDNETVLIRFMPLYILTITIFLVTIPRIFQHNPNQPKRRILAAIGRLSVLLAMAMSVLFPTLILPFYPLPQPTGSFNVGTVVCDFSDNNRTEAFADTAGKPREIAVQFWYPADRTGIKPEYDIKNALVSNVQQNYPVLIFSHGAFGVRMSNASTFRELASHGYIVASIDHTYHSFFTSFANGKKVPVSTKFLNEVMGVMNNKLTAEDNFQVTHDWMKLRTADIELVIDSLKAGKLGSEGTFLNGHMDLENIGLFGHSLGGAAAAQVSRERNDVKAAIVLDGTMIGDITGLDSDNKEILTKESIIKPLMLMYGSLFNNPAEKDNSYMPNINAFNKAKSAVYSLCIKDSGHLNFTDLPRISPFLSRMLGIGTVDAFDCIKIVNDYSLAFFDKHIKGQNSTLIDGTLVNDKVEFEKRISGGIGN